MYERNITNARDNVFVFNFICSALHRIVGISVKCSGVQKRS